MKTHNTVPKTEFSTGGTFAFALLATMAITVCADELSRPDLANRAAVSSPCVLEQFSIPARQAPPRTVSTPRTESVLSAIKKNHALASSPRMREQFPELTRTWQPSIVESAKSGTGETQLEAVMKNHALASSPRMREQFPELTRTWRPSVVDSAKSGTGETQLATVMKNHALATSPRMREQFPELARGYTFQPAKESLQVAPLK